MALGFMRRHRRWLNVSLGVVVVAFIIAYVPAFRQAQSGTPAEALATVGGETITAGEFQRAYAAQRRRIQDMAQGQGQGRIDAAMLKRMHIEEQVFSQLVTERLTAIAAERLGVRVDDEALAREIEHTPSFQRDGRFMGAADLKRMLQARGMTTEQFEDAMRQDLVRERLEALVTAGVTVTEAEAEKEFREKNERVKLEYVLVDATPLRAQVQASEADLQARFKEHAEDYRVPEKRVLSYLLVDPEKLRAGVTLTDLELERYYRDHQEEFQEPEQVCASHVLIKVKTAPEAKEGHSESEAQALATAVLEKAKAGADFAELAKKSSEDLGSGPRGGDLGCFGRGQMVPEFDQAAFALATPGALSDLVKTSFGFHIIRLQSHKDESVPALSQVKDGIRQTLQTQRVQALAAEKVQALSAALAGGRALEDVAREQGQVLQKSPAFERGKAPAPLSAPAVAARAFALKPGETDREGVPLGNAYVFFALAEIQPSRAAEFKDVKDQVQADYVKDKAFAAAQAAALELRTRAEKDGLEKAAAATNRTRKETSGAVTRGQAFGDLGTSAELDAAAFALAPQALSAPVRTPAGYALLRVTEKQSADEKELQAQKPKLMSTLRDKRRRELFQAYLNDLRQHYPVERRSDVFRRLVG